MSKNKYIFAIEGIVDNESVYYSNILYRRFKKHARKLKESKLAVNKLMPMPVELKDKITFYNPIDNTQDVEINERSTIKIPTFTTDVDYYSKIFIETNKENLKNSNLKSIFENKKISATIIGDKIDHDIKFMKELQEIDLSKEIFIQEISLSSITRSITGGLHKVAQASMMTGISCFTINTVTQVLTGHGIANFLTKSSIANIGTTGASVFGAYLALSLLQRYSRFRSAKRAISKFLIAKMKTLGRKSQEIIVGAFSAFKKHKITEFVGGKALKTPLGKIINRVDFDDDAIHLVTSPRSPIDYSAIKIVQKDDESIIKSLAAVGLKDQDKATLAAFKALGTFSDLLFYLAEKQSRSDKYKYEESKPDVDSIRDKINSHIFLKAGDKYYIKKEKLDSFLAGLISDQILLDNMKIGAINKSSREINVECIFDKSKILKLYNANSNSFKDRFINKIKEEFSLKNENFYKAFIETDNFEILSDSRDIIIEITNQNGTVVELKFNFIVDSSLLGRQINTLKSSIVTVETANFLGTDFIALNSVAGNKLPKDQIAELSDEQLASINNSDDYNATEEYRSTFVSKASMISNIVNICSDSKSAVNIKKCVGLLMSNGALDATKLHIALARIGYESASLFTDSNPGIFSAAKVFNDAIAATTQDIKCNDESGNFSLDVFQKSILENTLLSCLNLSSRDKHRAKIKEFSEKIYNGGLSSANIEKLIEDIYSENDKKPVTEFGVRMEKHIAESYMEILNTQGAIATADDGESTTRLEQFLKRKFADDNDPGDADKIEAIISHIRETGRSDEQGNIDHGEALFTNLCNTTKFLLKKKNKTDSEFMLGERNAELLNNILKSSGSYEAIFQESLALPSKGMTSAPTFTQKFKAVTSSISNLTLKTFVGLGLAFSTITPVIATYLESDSLQPSTEFQETIDSGGEIEINMKSLQKELLELQKQIEDHEEINENLKMDKCFLHIEKAIKFAEDDNDVGVKKLFSDVGLDYKDGSNVENYTNLVSFIYFINDQTRAANNCSDSFGQLHARLLKINKANYNDKINNITRSMIEKIQRLYKDTQDNGKKYENIQKGLTKIADMLKERNADLASTKPAVYRDVEEDDMLDRLIRGWDTKYVEDDAGKRILVPVNYEELGEQFKDVSTDITVKAKTAIETKIRAEAFENNRIVILLNIFKNIKDVAIGEIGEIAERVGENIKVSALRNSGLHSGRIEGLIKFLGIILTSILFRFLKQLKLWKGQGVLPTNIQGALIDAQDHVRIAVNFTIYHIESHILRNDIISVLDLNTKIMEETLKELSAKDDQNKKVKDAIRKIKALRSAIATEDLKSKVDNSVVDTDSLLRKLEIIR